MGGCFVWNVVTQASVQIGFSVTWCQYSLYDPVVDKCFYTKMEPCVNICPADVVMWDPPCHNFATVNEPWFSWGGPPDKSKGNYVCLVVENTLFFTTKTDTWNCKDYSF